MDQSSKPLYLVSQPISYPWHPFCAILLWWNNRANLIGTVHATPTVAAFTQKSHLTTNPMVIQRTLMPITVPSVVMQCNTPCFNLSRTPTRRIPTNQINIFVDKTNHLHAAAPNFAIHRRFFKKNTNRTTENAKNAIFFPITDQLSSTRWQIPLHVTPRRNLNFPRGDGGAGGEEAREHVR